MRKNAKYAGKSCRVGAFYKREKQEKICDCRSCVTCPGFVIESDRKFESYEVV